MLNCFPYGIDQPMLSAGEMKEAWSEFWSSASSSPLGVEEAPDTVRPLLQNRTSHGGSESRSSEPQQGPCCRALAEAVWLGIHRHGWSQRNYCWFPKVPWPVQCVKYVDKWVLATGVLLSRHPPRWWEGRRLGPLSTLKTVFPRWQCLMSCISGDWERCSHSVFLSIKWGQSSKTLYMLGPEVEKIKHVMEKKMSWDNYTLRSSLFHSRRLYWTHTVLQAVLSGLWGTQ